MADTVMAGWIIICPSCEATDRFASAAVTTAGGVIRCACGFTFTVGTP